MLDDLAISGYEAGENFKSAFRISDELKINMNKRRYPIMKKVSPMIKYIVFDL
jgi:hypothetical protein